MTAGPRRAPPLLPPARALAALATAGAAALVTLAAAGRAGLGPSLHVPAAEPEPRSIGQPAAPGAEAVAALAADLPSDARVRWDGVLWSGRDGSREVGVAAAGRVRLRINGALVVEHEAEASVRETRGTARLRRGENLVALEFEPAGGPPDVRLLWDAGNPHRLSAVPPTSLSAASLPRWRWRARAAAPAAVCVLVAVWAMALGWTAWRAIRRRVGETSVLASRPVVAVLGGAAVVCATGVWWGWPGPGWAADEIDPAWMMDALRHRFAGGWHERYPPLHFAVLAFVNAPALAAGRLGVVAVDTGPVFDAMFLASRLVSTAMAVGTLAVVAVLADRLWGRGHAWPAALVAGAAPPFVFHAKTANLEAPYLFWFAVSLVFLVACVRDGRRRDFVGFGVTAALAVATKDQAYGLYLLPACFLAWRAWRRGWLAGVAAGALASAATFALAHNLVFNWTGFLVHLEAIRGGASEGFRMFPPAAGGQAALASASARELVWTIGWPGAVAAAAGLALGWRRIRADGAAWIALGLAGLSYYAAFVAVVGYVYDRFLLPVALLAALAAAPALRRLADGWPRPAAGRLAAAALGGWLVWRAVSIDLLLLGDGRYAVEAWLHGNVPAGAVVASVDESTYLPRLGAFREHLLHPLVAQTLAVAPDFIVLNAEQAARHPEGVNRRTWQAWLESGAAPYDEVFRYKRTPAWSVLRWAPRFRDRVEDPFTNLDKANPEIAVYRRRPGAARPAGGDGPEGGG